MASDDYDDEPAAVGMLAGSWQAALFLGVVTLILGLIVTFHPTTSLNVLAVLLGILMILSGLFHLIRVFDPRERHRVWLGIAGLLFIVIGVILIRHLHLTRSIIGLVIGITWIVQGLTALIGGSLAASAWSASSPGSSWYPPPPPRWTYSRRCSASGSSSWASSRSSGDF